MSVSGNVQFDDLCVCTIRGQLRGILVINFQQHYDDSGKLLVVTLVRWLAGTLRHPAQCGVVIGQHFGQRDSDTVRGWRVASGGALINRITQ